MYIQPSILNLIQFYTAKTGMWEVRKAFALWIECDAVVTSAKKSHGRDVNNKII